LSHIACLVRGHAPGTVVREPSEQVVDGDEIRKGASPVDLDHGKVLAVCRLERGVAPDVDESKRERAQRLRLGDDLEGAVAEMAARSVEDRDRSVLRRAGRRGGRGGQG
jgi:hypothetical protein